MGLSLMGTAFAWWIGGGFASIKYLGVWVSSTYGTSTMLFLFSGGGSFLMIMTTNGLHSFLKISDLPLGGGFIDVW